MRKLKISESALLQRGESRGHGSAKEWRRYEGAWEDTSDSEEKREGTFSKQALFLPFAMGLGSSAFL